MRIRKTSKRGPCRICDIVRGAESGLACRRFVLNGGTLVHRPRCAYTKVVPTALARRTAKIEAASPLLPERFEAWFVGRGWAPRQHQLDLITAAEREENALLIAPTGAGKTLAGFLPTLIDLARPGRSNRAHSRLHTLYISPLKALAVDVERNLGRPIADLKLGVRIETRTGDTSVSKRKRQRVNPPDILLTTPEQLALLLASPDSHHLFADLRRVIFDELHAIVASKRGDLLALDLARLRAIAPMMRATGLSATVRDPGELRRWLVGQNPQDGEICEAALIVAPPGAKADLTILDSEQRMPWSGHSARHALAEVYAMIRRAGMTLIFVNTRSQAEFIFQALWRINDDSLPIALHHGSLDAGQRRRVEEAMAAGKIKAVVCTSTLDLGIDWGDVDLVVNIGAPKGASRLTQRIGRANHRLDEPSRAVMVPSNRFEVLECRAALEANAIGAQDTAVARAGALDVMCQHILGMACAGPFHADDLYAEIVSAEPYAGVDRDTFDRALAFVAHGGYALQSYERFAKIKQVVGKDGREGAWRIANGRVAQTYRMNVGTIVEATTLKVRLVRGKASPNKAAANESGVYTGPLRSGGRVLGELEEGFLESLVPGDTFLFGGEILALQGIVENEALVSRSRSGHASRAELRRRQVPAVDLPRRGCAQAAGGARSLGRHADAGRRMVGAAARALRAAAAGRSAGGDVPARRPALSRLLSFRGPPRPSDAWHAADAPNGARLPQAARFCRQ